MHILSFGILKGYVFISFRQSFVFKILQDNVKLMARQTSFGESWCQISNFFLFRFHIYCPSKQKSQFRVQVLGFHVTVVITFGGWNLKETLMTNSIVEDTVQTSVLQTLQKQTEFLLHERTKMVFLRS